MSTTKVKCVRKKNPFQPTAFDLMDDLANKDWCVVIKRLPPQIGWLLAGSRSEYDGASPDQRVAANKWLCEASYVGEDDYKHGEFAFGDTPEQAVNAVWWRLEG